MRPIGGVDPAARDYILNTIIANYKENASVIISTHLIADVEQILDEVVFIANGNITLQSSGRRNSRHLSSITGWFIPGGIQMLIKLP